MIRVEHRGGSDTKVYVDDMLIKYVVGIQLTATGGGTKVCVTLPPRTRNEALDAQINEVSALLAKEGASVRRG